jgi:regulator of RNase E activity RraA
MTERLSTGELMQLKRFNTPAVYNGWEQITRRDRRTCFNLDETRDFMPDLGPMVGRAVTVVCQPGEAEHQRAAPDAPERYRDYVASVPGPKIVVVQDLDRPRVYGAFWGEVMAGTHRALGCVGTITDGGVRDLDEMRALGFKALARRACVGHAWSWPVRWGVEVEAFACPVRPGQLVHADKHGFLVVPEEDEARLLEATRFLDGLECDTVIAASATPSGRSGADLLAGFAEGGRRFGAEAARRFGGKGEW